MNSLVTRFLLLSSVAALSLAAPQTVQAQDQAQAQATRATSEYNLASGIGLHGYDPVAVFPEGGGKPMAGLAQFSLAYNGVTYMFANCENREMFKTAPQKYEPSYGGWCAYAMASGSKVDIQPTLFTIHGNRAHYFVAARAKANFDSEVDVYETRADANWKQISGEDARK